TIPKRPLAVRQKPYRSGKGSLCKGQKYWLTLLLRFRQSIGQLPEGLRCNTRREVIGVELRLILLMKCGDRVCNEIHVHDVDLVRWTKRQNGQTREKDKCLDHVELRRFRMAAVAQDDAGTEDGFRRIWQQHPRHVLAEFLGTRIRIVIRSVPIDRLVFRDEFV